jgi:hypothetical protein
MFGFLGLTLYLGNGTINGGAGNVSGNIIQFQAFILFVV